MSSLPVVDQPARRIGALLEHVGRSLRQHSLPALEQLGVRPRHVVALTLLRDLGGSSQADLAGLLQMDRTNIVGLLNDLETEGWIERRRSPEDRRRHIVELTPAGAEILSRIEFALAAIEDHVLAKLDTAQRAQLWELLWLAADLEVEPGGC